MFLYSVVSAELTTPTTLLLTLKAREGERLFAFQPGQYASINFVKHFRPSASRSFSIVTSPTQQDTLQFGIRLKGKYTHALTKLKEGDTVQVRGPFGHFVFDAPRQQEIVMLAGGIGITPFISMTRFASSLGLVNKLTLIYSVRDQTDVAFADELAEHTKQNPNFTLAYAVSDGPTDKLRADKIYHSRVSAETLHDITGNDLADKTFFICGPPPFMNALIDTLHSHGVPYSQIITEAFSQGPGQQSGKMRSLPLNIYTLGALGTVASSFLILASDLIKTLPSSIMPATLTNKKSASPTNSSRQNDIDALVNNLSVLASTGGESPALAAANKEVAAAQTKVDEVNAMNAKNTGTTYVAKTKSTASSNAPASNASGNTPAAPTPTPSPATPPANTKPAPVCTTSPSGVTTCN